VTLVVDASLMLACVLEDERTDVAVTSVLARLKAGEALIAPFHFPVELMSGIEQAARRGRMAAGDRAAAYAAALEPGIELVTLPVEGDRGAPPLFELLDRTGLRVYDALYLQLALARRAALASLDDALRAAAVSEGVPVVPAPLHGASGNRQRDAGQRRQRP